MRWNPVFWKEITVDSRSVRLPVVIFIFNLILSAAAIFNIYNLNMHARLTAEIQYSAILELYSLISTLEFVQGKSWRKRGHKVESKGFPMLASTETPDM